MDGWRVEEIDVDRDLDGVLDLDNSTFSSPWTRSMYLAFLASAPSSHLLVMRAWDDALLGYCSFMEIVDELHIQNIAIQPHARGQGLGRALLDYTLRFGVARGARHATLEVRRSNAAARQLYASAGFVEEGCRRNYYTAPTEDGMVLWLRDMTGMADQNPIS